MIAVKTLVPFDAPFFQGTLLNNPIKLISSESRVPATFLLLTSSYLPSLINRPRSKWPLSNFRMNRIFAKTRVFTLSISEETMNDASFVRFDTISECDGQTDRETDGHLCYCNISECMACYTTVLVKILA